MSFCRKCDYQRYKQKEKEYVKQYYKNNYLQNLYNISPEEYDKMLKEQNNCCKICKTSQEKLKVTLAVDHCHKTGKVRGLLCNKCNLALGLLKDDLALLQEAINYLSMK